MATLNPNSELPSVARDTVFTRTISAVAGNTETITAVTATTNFDDDEIVITPGVTSVTISGQHTSAFSDTAKYVSKGSSDKLETPIVTTNLSSLPEDYDLYEYKPDSSGSKTRTFTVYVTSSANGVTEHTLTQDVINSVTGFTNFIHGYFSNRRGTVSDIQTEAVITWLNASEQTVEWKNNSNQTIKWTQ